MKSEDMNVTKLGKVHGFEWDRANIDHVSKHQVIPEEAEDVFFDGNQVISEDLAHSIVEKRFLIIGKTKKGRILYQVFTVRENKIRVISSRDINKKEVVLYEKETSHS